MSAIPIIQSVSPIAAAQNQTITITGSGFGSETPYNGDSRFIELTDVTGAWNAELLSRASLEISSDFGINRGDQVRLTLWNASAGTGPAVYQTRVEPNAAIKLVINGAKAETVIAPNTWTEIFGTNLATDTRGWLDADFVNGRMPASLNGVSVTVGGTSAYVSYISPTQVNILTPPGAVNGAVKVQIANNGAMSAAYRRH